ncbi:MAG: substrate-binding domain-containing protein [Clostridiales bacterium]|nr:substrate-binding domain-containing protein [Clostridiales bacterium]
MKRIVSVVICIALLAFSLVACASEPAQAPAEPAEQPSATQAPEPAEPADTDTGAGGPPTMASGEYAMPEKPFKVGFSNGMIGNGWRNEMTDDIIRLAELYKERGWVESINVQHAGVDNNAQIQHIRAMIQEGCDLIVCDPNSMDAMNPVMEEAVAAGILVISTDQGVTSTQVLNVKTDYAEWNAELARWLCDKLGGEGDIIMVSGIAGHSANVERVTACMEVLEQYPGINLLTEVNGNWDQSVAQQAVASVLSSYPNIDGVLGQDGHMLGTIQAFEAAGRELPLMSGETMKGFLVKWQELKDTSDFETMGLLNPPGVSATALGIGCRLLLGYEFKDGVITDANGVRSYFQPFAEPITNSNLDAYLETLVAQSDAYYPDYYLSEEELDALFN